jgi:glutamate-1-semialdehyde 2,1-aminomutase
LDASSESQLVKTISQQLFERAKKVLPGGATRSFRAWDPYPFYGKRAYGSKLEDLEGNVYTDYWMAHGAEVLGHLHPAVVKAAKEQIELGFFFGTCNEWEVKLAEQMSKLVPSVKMLTFNNSGTEAILHAIKLARAYTKRAKIAKFEWHYHSVVEAIYTATNGPASGPDSAGHDPLSQKNTVVLPLHDADAAHKAIKKKDLACVWLEAFTSAYTVPEEEEFVKGLREVCTDTDTLLILDEVVTGFRTNAGGAQAEYGVTPDLTTFGKAIAGGEFPVGAVGGRSDIMELMDATKHPGPQCVVQGGTYSGNSLVMHAGCEAMKVYEEGSMYPRMNRLGEKLMKGLEEAIEETHANARVTGYKSTVKIHFPRAGAKVTDDRSLLLSGDKEIEKKYFKFMLSKGILVMIPAIPHFYVTFPHTDQEIDEAISASRNFLKSMPK